jgi:hypothetical protein
MVSLVSVTVHVESQHGRLLCEVFNDMQSWLDTNKIEPRFHLTGGRLAGLDLCFSTAEQAALFREAFPE